MLVLLWLVSCSKEQVQNSSDAPNVKTDSDISTAFKAQISDDFDQKKLQQSPNGGYSDDDVIYIVEEAMNRNYADPQKSSGKTFTATQLFEVEKQGGSVSQSALDDFYAQAVLFASNHFYCICPDPDNQDPVLYDVALDSTNTNYLRLSVTSIVAIRAAQGLPITKRFQPEEEHPATDFDACDQGNFIAAYVLEQEYTNYNKKSVGGYYTDIEKVWQTSLNGWRDVNQNDPNPGDMILENRTWGIDCYNGAGMPPHIPHCPDLSAAYVEEYCLQEDELNYYLDQISEIYDDNKPDGKIFAHCELNKEILLTDPDYKSELWACTVRYGAYNVIIGPSRLPTDFCD